VADLVDRDSSGVTDLLFVSLVERYRIRLRLARAAARELFPVMLS